MIPNLPTVKVSELNAYVKSLFESDARFAAIAVSGEISNLSPHARTGHLYFSLKDETCSVKAVMFAREASRLRFIPENGAKVVAVGRVTVFERDGVYQLYVRELIPDGAGALALAFEQLKKKLEAEGLFSPAHKKALPAFPERIGVITSPNGAALQDILNIVGRRFPLCEVIVVGVSVQGRSAAAEIARAIRYCDKNRIADVLIVGRGGGSAEDLWCFNDEALARTVWACETPVVSAVGHETDFTICDFVADRRAPTPSAAAELVTPDILSLTHALEASTDALAAAYARILQRLGAKLDVLLAKRSFTDAAGFFESEAHRVSAFASRLTAAFGDTLTAEEARFNRALRAFQTAPDGMLRREETRADRAGQRLTAAIERTERAETVRYTHLNAALGRLNPLDVLLRGYTAVEKDGGIISSVSALAAGDRIRILLADGAADATVTGVSERK